MAPKAIKHASPARSVLANQGRIIVADTNNNRLQAFTHEGHHISSFDCGIEEPVAVAFDEHRGLIAFSAGHRVHVIGANQWLADTKFTYSSSSSPSFLSFVQAIKHQWS